MAVAAGAAVGATGRLPWRQRGWPCGCATPRVGPVVIDGLTRIPVGDPAAAAAALAAAAGRRRTAATGRNGRSSRFHALFTIYVPRPCVDDGCDDEATTARALLAGAHRPPRPRAGATVTVVDLAGSERAVVAVPAAMPGGAGGWGDEEGSGGGSGRGGDGDSGGGGGGDTPAGATPVAARACAEEAAAINSSLLALSNCLRVLVANQAADAAAGSADGSGGGVSSGQGDTLSRGRAVVPYRDTMLTKLLALGLSAGSVCGI